MQHSLLMGNPVMQNGVISTTHLILNGVAINVIYNNNFTISNAFFVRSCNCQ